MTEVSRQNNRLGIFLMIATTFVFAMQDGISRYLAEHYNVFMVVMIRFWFFAAFVIALTMRRPGSLRAVLASKQKPLQILRGILLATEISLMVVAFTKLGLLETHVVFASYPLIIAALSGPILGEKVGPLRWGAIFVGFIGMVIILQPGYGVFSIYAFVALMAATLFGLYGLLTRYVARRDSAATSFFWTGVSGAVAITFVGAFYWQNMTAGDWAWMGVLCITSALGHYLLIKCYDVAEASAVQPFTYFQLCFISIIGVWVFDETLQNNVIIGASIIVAAGLFTLWRTNRQAKNAA